MSDIFLQEFDSWYLNHSKDPEERKRIKEKMTNYYLYVLNKLLKLAKGQAEDDVFYSSFTSRLTDVGIPHNAIAVREKLKKAWWVEEEDVKQFLLMTIWKHQLSTMSSLVISLRRFLRDYLINDCKVFSRQIKWKRRYSWYISEVLQARNVDHDISALKSLISRKENYLYSCYGDEYSLWDRIKIYLKYHIRISGSDLIHIIHQSRKQFDRDNIKFEKRVKRLIHGSNVTNRYRKGCATKREDWTRTRENKYPWPSINVRKETI